MSAIFWLMLIVVGCGLAIQAARMVLMSKQRAHAHDVLVNRVKRLRLYKMLEFLGANQDEYLRVVPATDVNQQIHRCSHCKAPDVCDRSLRDGKRIVNMNFCPNHKSLTEHSKTIFLRKVG
jgi:hypothetical protein